MPDCACGCGRAATYSFNGLNSSCYQRWRYHGKPPFDQIPPARGPHVPVAERLEDYLFIGGDRLTQSQVAQRLGVTVRSVQRYRRALREATA